MPAIYKGRDLIEYLRTQGLEDTSPQALRPGERVVKQNSEPGDTHIDGALGTLAFVHKPIPGPDGKPMQLAWVYWDDVPDAPIASLVRKVGRVH
jgi:hypothetical protein